MVDPESCTPACFEGYIQATCNPEGSSVDQVFWTANFVPNPSCKLFALTCTNPLNQPCGAMSSAVLGLNCDGTARPNIGPISNAGTVFLCAINVIPNLVSGYTMTPAVGCCADCSQYTVTVTPLTPQDVLDGSSVYYIDCTTRELIRVDLTGSQPYVLTTCMVTGSIYTELTPQVLGSITPGIPCP
jgi:hypothetical protein